MKHLIPLLVLSVAGCDLLEAEAPQEVILEPPPSSELEGLYTIDSWRVDEGDCENLGTVSNPLNARFVVVGASDVIRGPHLFSYPCNGAEGCANLQDNSDSPGLIPYSISLVEGNDQDGWRGEWSVDLIDRENEGLCNVSHYDYHVFLDGSDQIVRQAEITRGSVPLVGEQCPADVTIEDVPETERCYASTTLMATFEQAVPPIPPSE